MKPDTEKEIAWLEQSRETWKEAAFWWSAKYEEAELSHMREISEAYERGFAEGKAQYER